MLRRILSPRQPQENKSSTSRVGQFVDTKPRSQSSSAIQFNGLLGLRGSEEGEEITNSSYGDPDHFQPPVRTQSMVATPTRDMNPPLPPRNLRPPLSYMGEEESESSVYVTPADTLRKLANPPSANSQSSAAADPEALPTKSERRVMQLHQLTINQKRGQVGAVTSPVPAVKPSNGHQQTGSNGNVTEDSEYSVPFNLVQANENRTRPPPVKPPRVIGKPHDECIIIPINPPSLSPQPLSDRSDTNSPSSPMSNQSSPPPRQDEGGSDYAIPWDRNKIFQNIPHMPKNLRSKPPKWKSGEDSGYSEDSSPSSQHRLHGDPRETIQLHQQVKKEEQKPPREHSPPPPARGGFRYHSARDPLMSQQGVEVSPPPPELPFDPYRPNRNRAVSDHMHHRREGSTSPVGPGSHSQSVNHSRHPLPPLSRLDPPQERGKMESYPLPPPREQSTREDLGRPQVLIDVSIPLDDQPWYHGHVTRADAEDILKEHPDFSFLVRKSESCQTDFSLSIRDTSPGSGFYHLRLVFERDPPGYVLGQFSNHFEKVTECIAFYTKQRLNIRGAEHKRLRYPIPRGGPMDRGHGYLTTVGV